MCWTLSSYLTLPKSEEEKKGEMIKDPFTGHSIVLAGSSHTWYYVDDRCGNLKSQVIIYPAASRLILVKLNFERKLQPNLKFGTKLHLRSPKV